VRPDWLPRKWRPAEELAGEATPGQRSPTRTLVLVIVGAAVAGAVGWLALRPRSEAPVVPATAPELPAASKAAPPPVEKPAVPPVVAEPPTEVKPAVKAAAAPKASPPPKASHDKHRNKPGSSLGGQRRRYLGSKALRPASSVERHAA
jgi:hypothetical protein